MLIEKHSGISLDKLNELKKLYSLPKQTKVHKYWQRSMEVLEGNCSHFRDESSLPFHVSYVERTVNSLIPLHTHDHYEMIVMLYGNCSHVVGGQTIKIAPGSVLLIKPRDTHKTIQGNESTVHASIMFLPSFVAEQTDISFKEDILFNFMLLAPFFGTEQSSRLLRLPMEALQRILPLCYTLVSAYYSAETTERYHIRNHFLSFCSALFVECREQFIQNLSERMSSSGKIISQSLIYIKDNISTDISINDLSAGLGLTKKYFSALFKQETGKLPKTYINELRIRLAQELLGLPCYSVTRIALEVGFNDIAYFHRQFRRQTGKTPLMYRRNLANKI